MTELRNISLTGNNSTLQTTEAHETRNITFRNPFTWENVMTIINATPLGPICDTPEEAKMQVLVLFYLIAGVVFAGFMDSLFYFE